MTATHAHTNGLKTDAELRRPLVAPAPTNYAQKLELVVTAANSASMGLIFAFRQFLPAIFVGLGRAILFPFNAAANIIRAILALYEAHKEGYKTPAVLRAAVAVISGLAISTAIIGALVAAAVFAVIGPILSIIGFSLRALYHSAAAIYYTVDYCLSNDPKEAQKSWDKAVANSVSAIQSALNAIAIGLVLLAFKASFGIMGIVAGALGACFTTYKAFTLKPPAAVPQPQDTPNETPKETPTTTPKETLSSTSRCQRGLTRQRSFSLGDISDFNSGNDDLASSTDSDSLSSSLSSLHENSPGSSNPNLATSLSSLSMSGELFFEPQSRVSSKTKLDELPQSRLTRSASFS